MWGQRLRQSVEQYVSDDEHLVQRRADDDRADHHPWRNGNDPRRPDR